MTHDHHLGMDDASRPAFDIPRAARDAMPGPIAPIAHFGTDARKVLSRYAREGLVPYLVLDGVAYVSYSDVHSGLFFDHFDQDLEGPAAWDGTYAPAWFPPWKVEARWIKPRGFKDAVRSDVFSVISLKRERRSLDAGDEEGAFIQAAYPRHVADRAAEMFQALYRQDGFLERFQQRELSDHYMQLIEPLRSFGDHEAGWFRKFAEDGAVGFLTGDEEYVARDELMYYDLFAAKIIEEEIDLDFPVIPRVDNTIAVMFDGTLRRHKPRRVPANINPNQVSPVDC